MRECAERRDDPLAPREVRRRLEALRGWGVDLSLVEASLRRTPDERVKQMLAMLQLADELRAGIRRAATAHSLPSSDPPDPASRSA